MFWTRPFLLQYSLLSVQPLYAHISLLVFLLGGSLVIARHYENPFAAMLEQILPYNSPGAFRNYLEPQIS